MKKTDISIMEELLAEIDNDNLVVYLGNGVGLEDSVEKRVILFTHKVERAGAPCVLVDMARVYIDMGYQVFIISHEDGEYSNDIINAGINYIYYEKYPEDLEWLKKIGEVFPTIVINTLLLIYIAEFLVPFSKQILWWIHEAEMVIENWADVLMKMPKTPVLKILAASPLIQKNLKDYAGLDSELLNFYVEDAPCQKVSQKKDVINIFNVGNINGNKGQDVLAKAYDLLDDETKAKSNLFFLTCNDYVKKELALSILDYVDTHENVHIMEGMPKEELYEVYEEMDIIVVASYYESTSAVAVEGMMKERLCICTETCGVCKYLEDGKSALMFKRGDAVGLSKVLHKAINHYDEFESMRKNGRAIYEQVYTKEIFKQKLQEIMKNKL